MIVPHFSVCATGHPSLPRTLERGASMWCQSLLHHASAVLSQREASYSSKGFHNDLRTIAYFFRALLRGLSALQKILALPSILTLITERWFTQGHLGEGTRKPWSTLGLRSSVRDLAACPHFCSIRLDGVLGLDNSMSPYLLG